MEDVARRYVTWTGAAFDIGGQTSSALSLVAGGTNPHASGTVIWKTAAKKPAGNGSLMRTAPIGVLFGKDADACRTASVLDSAITHADPRCVLACASFNAALAAAVHGVPSTATALIEAAEREIADASSFALTLGCEGDYASAAADLTADLRAAAWDDPQLTSGEVDMYAHQGFVRVAYRLAFWELLHARDYEDAILDVVNRGGDADTNAAITGAIVGALYGLSSIPIEWREAVMTAVAVGPAPLSHEYHPRVFAQLC